MKDMQGVRFKADHAGDEWQDQTDLAKLCEGAGLTVLQAEVVRLTAMKCDTDQTAAHLDLPRSQVRAIAASSENRLKKSQSWLRGALYREIRTWHECRRNKNCKPRPDIFRKVPGGYDRAAFSARPHGEAPEDLIEERDRLLRTLPRLLEGRREEAAVP
jgi:hypothetical protein